MIARTGKRSPGHIVGLIVIGLAAGFLSGMFGVGGGIIIVPALVSLMAFESRVAAGTSLAAIVPLALVGVVSYALENNVVWIAGALLVVGAVGGSQVGSWLLSRVNQSRLQIGFAVFMVASAVMLFLVVPSRDATMTIGWVTGIALVATGFATGVLSGLLGVGGGIIVVPALMLLFGASDLMAKGTSLLVMIPTAVSGTVSNAIRGNVDLSAAAIVGVSACLTTLAGSRVAHVVSPLVANLCFAAFLIAVAANLVVKAVKKK